MTFAKRTTATWCVDLHANCPYCDHGQDILNDWGEQECWDEVKVAEAKVLCTTHGNEDLMYECEKCGKTVVISETEY